MFLQFKTPWGTHGTGGMVYRHAHAAYMALNVLKANISQTVHPIHSMFGSRLGFSGSVDRMALFAVR